MSETIPTTMEILDDRFKACRGDDRIERLYQGCRWAEGPVYLSAFRFLVWSDIPNDRLLRWDEHTGNVAVFRQPANHTNGNTIDAMGRLISCEQGSRRVTRTEHDGTISVLADKYDGKRLNSPNDVVERSDGSIWFTDPSYGIDSDYEGHRAASEIGACHVYRIDPFDKSCVTVATDFVRPNGLAFSLDESQIYIVDTRRNHIRVFEIAGDDELSGGEVFASCTAGVFDGIRLDDVGRLWVAAGDGVHCYDPDGTLLGKILLPEPVANLTFGGRKRNQLFICASTSVYSIMLTITGPKMRVAV